MIAALSLAAALLPQANDPISFSFAFFGCNRIEQDDWVKTRHDNPSSANIPQLLQNFQDAAASRPAPQLMFVVGDMTNNYVADQGETLREQLTAWQKLLPSSAMTLVPVPGNHELLSKQGKTRLPNPGAEREWLSWFKQQPAFKFAGNGPTPTNDAQDQLYSDQSTLSYSFDRGDIRFIVLNTDTFRRDSSGALAKDIAQIPVTWTQRQLETADRDPVIKHVFVLGHRNLVDPLTTTGDSPINPQQAESLAKAMTASKKARAFLCAHVHAYDVTTFGRADLFQIVAGHGGSQLEPNWNPPSGVTNGFSVIRVHQSGVVDEVGYHRQVPSDRSAYLSATASPAQPASPRVIYKPSVIRR